MTIYNRDNYILTDSPLKKDLLKLFKKNDKLTILDIGGCEGEESIRYSRIFPFSSIYVFEPLPDNQKLVAENIIKYKVENVALIPFAVSDEEGISQFYVSSGHPENQPKDLDWDFGNKSSSLLTPEFNPHKWLNFNDTINVKTITLNSFLANNKINNVDFIHMDVQGAELKVLTGANDFIKETKAIWLEVADIELYKNQPLRKDIENFMDSNGFNLVKSEIDCQVGDQFYLNKKYYKIISLFNRRLQFYLKK
ncbi:FkbM family methyltransferase [Flavobacterium franklandianum]|uniref:FkbM family methyltransferase n=1 Tax=Flavobacterium franklandianum TaxID=2594430 RepID=A0A553CK92_9FLAO|nr:FkbM family methyltransferase [Flavobacterium franklandianum]TRX20908.1 FkbM family methyltransferase [Flavobacterium franklandianum]TRX23150.1 FkbM family methyltransferase [Flavobacterium franklandianum]